MEIAAVVLASEFGMTDGGSLRMEGAWADWVLIDPASTAGPVQVGVLMRGLAPGQEVTVLLRALGPSGEMWAEVPYEAPAIAGRNHFAWFEIRNDLLGTVPGLVRLEAGFEGQTAPPVWTDIEIRV